MHGFAKPPAAYLTTLRKQVAAWKKEGGVSRPDYWARVAKVVGLADQREDALQARELLENAKARPALELLLTAGLSVDDVHRFLRNKTAVRTSLEIVKLYAHYFWDASLMSETAWYTLFTVHPKGALLRGCLAQGPDFALWKLGHLGEFKPTDVVKRVMAESAMRFMELTHLEPSRDTAFQAKLWAENIFKASEQLDRSGDAVKQIIDEIKGVSLRLGTRKISSLEDLRRDGPEDT